MEKEKIESLPSDRHLWYKGNLHLENRQGDEIKFSELSEAAQAELKDAIMHDNSKEPSIIRHIFMDKRDPDSLLWCGFKADVSTVDKHLHGKWSDEKTVDFQSLPEKIKEAVLDSTFAADGETKGQLNFSEYLSDMELAKELGQKLLIEQYVKNSNGKFELYEEYEADDFNWTVKDGKAYWIFDNHGELQLNSVSMSKEEMLENGNDCFYKTRRESLENDRIIDCLVCDEDSDIRIFKNTTIGDDCYLLQDLSQKSIQDIQDIILEEIDERRKNPGMHCLDNEYGLNLDQVELTDRNGNIIEQATAYFNITKLTYVDQREQNHQIIDGDRKETYLEKLPSCVSDIIVTNIFERPYLYGHSTSFRGCGCTNVELRKFLESESKEKEQSVDQKKPEKKKHKYRGR